MKKTIKRAVLTALVLSVPSVAFGITAGLVGDCADCHTMHNSEQGSPVATAGIGGTALFGGPGDGIPNLLRMDCIACHAQNGPDAIVDMGNGSAIPQVYHQDTTDLAGGNFAYIDTLGSSRKGHNVMDLFAGGDNNADTYGAPPGKLRNNTHGPYFSDASTYDRFTCAGSIGCHGTRSQLLSGDTGDWDSNTSTANTFEGVKRTGIAAITGAHHASYDGAKDPAAPTHGDVHSGQNVADGYRFIPGLKGYGLDDAVANRWQNIDDDQHNEYYGAAAAIEGYACHLESHGTDIDGDGTADNYGFSTRMALDSTLAVPNQSMSGFCSTCHGYFHSSGTGLTEMNHASQGTSGAFLRHPSDFVIPNEREYSNYTVYDISAPVARPSVPTAASATVSPGSDMVMCLSCHKAHGSEEDYMLRFDYNDGTAMLAGSYATVGDGQAQGGCLACHTTKGTLPENR